MSGDGDKPPPDIPLAITSIPQHTLLARGRLGLSQVCHHPQQGVAGRTSALAGPSARLHPTQGQGTHRTVQPAPLKNQPLRHPLSAPQVSDGTGGP